MSHYLWVGPLLCHQVQGVLLLPRSTTMGDNNNTMTMTMTQPPPTPPHHHHHHVTTITMWPPPPPPHDHHHHATTTMTQPPPWCDNHNLLWSDSGIFFFWTIYLHFHIDLWSHDHTGLMMTVIMYDSWFVTHSALSKRKIPHGPRLAILLWATY